MSRRLVEIGRSGDRNKMYIRDINIGHLNWEFQFKINYLMVLTADVD